MTLTQADRPPTAAHPNAAAGRTGKTPAGGATHRRLPTARAVAAFALANARYWLTLAVHVRGQIRHWEARARAIEDPDLRALALAKLHTEGFNAEAAAMAATLAPRVHRKRAAQAIVALELMFDYLDGLTERPHPDPLGEGERLYAAFVEAVDTAVAPAQPAGGYVGELAGAVKAALAQLPASEAIGQVAQRCAARGAEAQIRMHATPLLGDEQLAAWAAREAEGTALAWREFLAGAACSVLSLHALIAAAADPRTTHAEAERIDAAYLAIGAMVTLLDGLVDRPLDVAEGELSYIALYEHPSLLAEALICAAREAAQRARELRNAPHHLMTLAGAAAYWSSAPGARNAFARPAVSRLRKELQPLVFLPLVVMHAWRATRARPVENCAKGRS